MKNKKEVISKKLLKQLMSEDEDCLKYTISFEKGKPFKFERQSLKDIKKFGKKLLNEEKEDENSN